MCGSIGSDEGSGFIGSDKNPVLSEVMKDPVLSKVMKDPVQAVCLNCYLIACKGMEYFKFLEI